MPITNEEWNKLRSLFTLQALCQKFADILFEKPAIITTFFYAEDAIKLGLENGRQIIFTAEGILGIGTPGVEDGFAIKLENPQLPKFEQTHSRQECNSRAARDFFNFIDLA